MPLFISCNHAVIADFTSFMPLFSSKHAPPSPYVPSLIAEHYKLSLCLCLSVAPHPSITSPDLQWQRLQGSHLTDSAFAGILIICAGDECVSPADKRQEWSLLHTRCPLTLAIVSFLSDFDGFSVMTGSSVRQKTMKCFSHRQAHPCVGGGTLDLAYVVESQRSSGSFECPSCCTAHYSNPSISF